MPPSPYKIDFAESHNSLSRREARSQRMVRIAKARVGFLAREAVIRARLLHKEALKAIQCPDTRELAILLSRESRGCVDSWARLVRLPMPAKEAVNAGRAVVDMSLATVDDVEILSTLGVKPQSKADPAGSKPVDPVQSTQPVDNQGMQTP